jgi:hypothetical protein
MLMMVMMMQVVSYCLLSREVNSFAFSCSFSQPACLCSAAPYNGWETKERKRRKYPSSSSTGNLKVENLQLCEEKDRLLFINK